MKEVRLSILPRVRSSITFTRPSLTDQSAKRGTDVNVIMEQYALTGMLPQQTLIPPSYQDNTLIPPLEASLEAQKRANELFLSLPLDVRTRLHHDPENLANFIADPANKEYCIQQGLLTMKEKEIGQKEIVQEIKNLTETLKSTKQGVSNA